MELDARQTICRACLTEEGLFQSVFLKGSGSGLSMHISEMLNACTTIQVNKGDGLPDQICFECSEHTVKMYLFKLLCEKSDIILRDRFEKGNAETVEIKYECDNISIDVNLINDFENDKFKCNIDKEMWEKNEEKKMNKVLKKESKIKEIKSNICQESINRNILLTSQEIADDIKVEKLEIIDEDLKTNYDSISPPLTESNEVIFPCPECDLVFAKSGNLEEHISNLHIKKEPKVSCDKNLKREQQFVDINYLIDVLYDCDICVKGFSQKSELEEHMKTHTSTLTQTVEQPTIINTVCNKELPKTYKCDICEKTFTSSGNLSRHKILHTGEKRYECDICKRKFTDSSSLRSHNRIHTGEKPYQCDICEMKFTRSSYLKYHKIKYHMGVKPFECEVCKRKFIQSGHLTVHKRTHTGEKPYECEICKKKFTKLSDLRRHKSTHTGEKPFKCMICEKKFANSANLRTHKRIHTGEKPYRCDICGMKFPKNKALKKHKSTHTGEKYA